MPCSARACRFELANSLHERQEIAVRIGYLTELHIARRRVVDPQIDPSAGESGLGSGQVVDLDGEDSATGALRIEDKLDRRNAVENTNPTMASRNWMGRVRPGRCNAGSRRRRGRALTPMASSLTVLTVVGEGCRGAHLLPRVTGFTAITLMAPFKCARCGHWRAPHDSKTGKCKVILVPKKPFGGLI